MNTRYYLKTTTFLSRLSIVNTEDGRSIFTLNPAAPSDAGLYKVVARNPLGQVTSTVRVVLGDISGSPDSPSVEAMTDTDILLSWKTPQILNHAPVIAYKVQMGYIGMMLKKSLITKKSKATFLLTFNRSFFESKYIT